MKIGFSTLSLFMKSLENILEIATFDGFELLEILCEGPYWPRYLIENKNKEELDIFNSYDIEILLHAPTIDLNPASMNEGIRTETKKQTKETIDLANHIGAIAITTHPGVVHRREERIKNLATDFAIDVLTECQEYGEDVGVILSVENMPSRFSYLANTPEEHLKIIEKVNCSATIDLGHANTYENPKYFLNLPKIAYFHLNDNMGEKDQHLSLGEGTADFSLDALNRINKGIIELNSYEMVLKSQKFLKSKLDQVNIF